MVRAVTKITTSLLVQVESNSCLSSTQLNSPPTINMEASFSHTLPHRVSSNSLNLGYIRILDSSDSDEAPSLAMKVDMFARRRKGISGSSTSLSPTVPTLEVPSAFHVSAIRSGTADDTIRAKNKPGRVLALPSMFQDDDEDEDDDNLLDDVTCDCEALAGISTVHVEHRIADEGEVNQPQTQHYEESFATRAVDNEHKARVNQDSIVVVEIKINAKVSRASLDNMQLLTQLDPK